MTIESLREIDKCCQTLCDAWTVKAEIKQLEAQLVSARQEETKKRTMLRMFVESIEAGNDDGIISAYRDAKEYLG